MLQRGGYFAERGERGHHAARGPGAERVEGGELPPPVRRRAVVAPCRCVGRERLERCADALREPAALGVRPALELREAIDEEAVEEGTAIRRDGGPRITVGQRILESLHVAGEGRRIEAQLRGSQEQLTLAEVAAQCIAGLLQQAATMLCIAIGPKIGGDFVAAQPARVRGE